MVGPEIARRLPVFDNLRITYRQVIGVFIFGAASACYNLARRIPPRSTMIRHFLVASLGLYPGKKADELLEKKRNYHVLVLEDYISRHPEDFPLATPKKYKDLLLPWTPVR
ncbi:NADH dehydrogenase [ubiquinone] 1 subunit C2 [Biomphalaria glabrata]|uniref:Uncharacterized protein LOC106054563 n=2 Tax=Biomphalaria TaxID=6525 RepID=A0A2C9L738_BIOGL|nr:uncharacterized protein LOC106054563 [Biomphalaria glabrata]KAI8756808.1 dehydrogenase [ubiquinone] 1 subunit C2-like [Biomphalaria glabrata]KAI8798225.1 NADH dehydrogenase [ubiquinone] 1 subunit C2 [Biomphalaria glabrata]KAK0047358.1 NADH dehydrogenase [ubiquinone] 1 subunit C2 [Biomphalaria pfeifferi]